MCAVPIARLSICLLLDIMLSAPLLCLSIVMLKLLFLPLSHPCQRCLLHLDSSCTTRLRFESKMRQSITASPIVGEDWEAFKRKV